MSILLLIKEKWLPKIIKYNFQYILIADFNNYQEILFKLLACYDFSYFERFICFGEAQVKLVAKLNTHFLTCGLQQKNAEFFRDKYLMKCKAESIGVLVPAYADYLHRHKFYMLHSNRLKSNINTNAVSLLIKPRQSWGCYGIKKFNLIEEAEEYFGTLEDPNDYMLEEFIDGDMYHVGGLINQGKTIYSVVVKHDTPILELGKSQGEHMMLHTIDQRSELSLRLKMVHDQISHGFGLEQGLTFIEFFHTKNDQILLCEAAARHPALGVPKLYEIVSGRNYFYEYAHILATGNTSIKTHVLDINNYFAGIVHFASLPGKLLYMDMLKKIDDDVIVFKSQRNDIVGTTFKEWSFKNSLGKIIIKTDTEDECLQKLRHYKSTFKYMLQS